MASSGYHRSFKRFRVSSGPVPPSPCPGCGKKLDYATGVGVAGDSGPVTPEEGSVTICAYCNNYAVFDAQLHLREATEADLAKLVPEARDIFAKWTETRKVRTN